MDFRIVLQDLNGVPRGELFRIRSAVWSTVLNGKGAADVLITHTDPAATVELLTKAPRMVIYAGSGNWGGVVKRNIRQTGAGLLIGAWSNERLLERRQTAKTRSLDGYTNGVIAQTLLTEANAAWPTGVTAGDIYTAGSAHYYEIHYDELLERFQKMAAFDSQDFEVTWDCILNWYERKGTDKPNVVLSEGRNLVRWPTYRYSEDGIVNDQHCVGDGISWSEKITAQASDTESQNVYGLWQAMNVYGSISEQTTLDLRAETLLADRKDPEQTIDLAIVDRPEGLWASFTVGDRVRVVMPNYHFGEGLDMMVKVLAREVNAGAGIMRAVVDVS